MAHRAPARSSGLLSSIGVNLVSRRNGGRIGAYSPHCPSAGKSHGDDATICDKFSADRPTARHDRKVVIQFLLDTDSLFPARSMTPVTNAEERTEIDGRLAEAERKL